MRRVNRRDCCQIAVATALCGSWARRSVAQNTRPVRRVAIGGFDPVAYFTDGRPIKGSSSFSVQFDEADYFFASAEHQRMFVADPDHYAPRYSGYCAIGVSLDHKAEVDPESWAISNGRLYLFHYKRNMQEFPSDSSNIIAKADANWASVKKAAVFDHGDEIDRAAQNVPR
jgi:YHS domain-containing protein